MIRRLYDLDDVLWYGMWAIKDHLQKMSAGYHKCESLVDHLLKQDTYGE